MYVAELFEFSYFLINNLNHWCGYLLSVHRSFVKICQCDITVHMDEIFGSDASERSSFRFMTHLVKLKGGLTDTLTNLI